MWLSFFHALIFFFSRDILFYLKVRECIGGDKRKLIICGFIIIFGNDRFFIVCFWYFKNCAIVEIIYDKWFFTFRHSLLGLRPLIFRRYPAIRCNSIVSPLLTIFYQLHKAIHTLFQWWVKVGAHVRLTKQFFTGLLVFDFFCLFYIGGLTKCHLLQKWLIRIISWRGWLTSSNMQVMLWIIRIQKGLFHHVGVEWCEIPFHTKILHIVIYLLKVFVNIVFVIANNRLGLFRQRRNTFSDYWRT